MNVKNKNYIFAIPGIVFIILFFVYPILGILLRSFNGDPITFDHYLRLAAEPIYLKILFNTFEIAFGVTVITLLLGYPIAYLFCNIKKKTLKYLIIFIVVPYFTSSLIRTYAWIILLGKEGVVNKALLFLNLTETPLQLMYNRFAVLIGISYILLPYMILSIYSVMKGIDKGLLRASQSLGANAFNSFRLVLLPLSLPGITSGSLLVFILTLGYFITPSLMGGPKDAMISMIIDNQIEVAMDWEFGSVLSVLLLSVTLIGFFVYNRLLGIEKMFERK